MLTQTQWYQSSQASQPIMGVPSSCLPQAGQTQTSVPSLSTYLPTVWVVMAPPPWNCTGVDGLLVAAVEAAEAGLLITSA